ncbi:RNA-binding protein [Desulfurococcus mucosus]|uniref:THUMP domain-containing protein n=1 Tax=Desulfurococcus mucosus (strain ATCC 35584 / DSM 2162 / JCM 9187 / O7/1) TaxID=765177 RepID=E8R6Z5_DESM0|nr:RNA-binding protein [Desulfurococcus mucosus]ADV64428.1 hypothetical protein Desmu_0109 [Desulfurococcus mucosus DSM 2162]
MECSVVLLVTCRTGSDEWCAREIGDFLFSLDSNVIVEETGFPGVLQVRSCIDAGRIYGRALSGEYGFVENIIPVQRVVPLTGLLRDPLGSLSGLELPERVKVRVRMRGVRGVSRDVFTSLVKELKERGIIHDPASTRCLFIESIGDKVYIGVGYCEAIRRCF